MKKRLLLLAVSLLPLLCCKDEKVKQAESIEKCRSLFIEAENKKQTIKTILLGISFDMKEEEYNEHLKRILKMDSGLIFKDSTYYYNYKLHTGEFKLMLVPFFYNDTLHSVSFIYYGTDELEKLELLVGLRRKYKDFKSAKCLIGDKEHSHYDYTYWIKDNLVVYFESSYNEVLAFSNAPVDKTSKRIEFSKEIVNETNQKYNGAEEIPRGKIQNSPWDGSVYQVKNYLKKNLKDPNSYESIEWSEVKKTDTGYTVRHKYRAKNSFGGFVIENQVFYLDSNGDVVNCVEFN